MKCPRKYKVGEPFPLACAEFCPIRAGKHVPEHFYTVTGTYKSPESPVFAMYPNDLTINMAQNRGTTIRRVPHPRNPKRLVLPECMLVAYKARKEERAKSAASRQASKLLREQLQQEGIFTKRGRKTNGERGNGNGAGQGGNGTGAHAEQDTETLRDVLGMLEQLRGENPTDFEQLQHLANTQITHEMIEKVKRGEIDD